jgi:hypothetical protein
MGWDCLWTAANNGPVIRPSCECGESLLNCQGITSELEGKAAAMPLCPPQIPGARTRASAARGRQLTAWAMLRTYFIIVVKDFGVTKFCPFYHSTDFFLSTKSTILEEESLDSILSWSVIVDQ